MGHCVAVSTLERAEESTADGRPLERERSAVLDERERRELVEDLLEALTRRGAGEGTRLLDLMRVEQNLVDALETIRRQIDDIVRSARAGEPDP